MAACTGGEVWRDGACRTDSATTVYMSVVVLLLGLGAIAVGVYLWRRGRKPPPAPAPSSRGTVWHEPRFGRRVQAGVVPWFLIDWGACSRPLPCWSPWRATERATERAAARGRTAPCVRGVAPGGVALGWSGVTPSWDGGAKGRRAVGRAGKIRVCRRCRHPTPYPPPLTFPADSPRARGG